MAESERRDPDELLADVQREEARARRGRLRIFFGASAGVGKTYSMLEAARAARAGGADIVVGYVEPHGRVETERLLEGLEQLPFLEVRYRGITRREFDLDAALKRAPAIVLVDELAHSNIAEGEPLPSHAKRWQDVEELLDAGISVWTTLNVQHLESLNDVVAGITGVRQQETLPDRIFDEADEVELIDLPPDDLLARLKAGKVYAADRVGTATEGFFRKPNLLALRELALRRTADRVDAAALEFAAQAPTSRPWLARDRFLIAVTPDGQAEQLVRIGKRFADALDAEWLVVSVETPQLLKLSESERNRRIDVLRLAESLGAETVTLDGPSAAEALLEYARLRNVTRIVIGEAKRTGWRALAAPLDDDRARAPRRGFDVSVIARRETRVVKAPGRARQRADRDPLGTLLGGAADLRVLHRRGGDHVPVFRPDEPRHGLPLGRDRRGPAGSGAVRRVSPRSPTWLHSTSASCRRGSHSRIEQSRVPSDVCGDAGDGARHREPRRERPRSNAGRRRPRAAHLVALRDEPRARRHPQLQQSGAGRDQTRRRDLCEPRHGAVARRRRAPASVCRAWRWRGRSRTPICPSRNGCSTTAGRPGLGTDTLPAASAQYLPLIAARTRRSVCSPCSPPSGAACCSRNSATSSRHLPARLRLPSSGRSAARRPRPPASLWKRKVCAIRCSRPSRTICALRLRRSRRRAARSMTRT